MDPAPSRRIVSITWRQAGGTDRGQVAGAVAGYLIGTRRLSLPTTLRNLDANSLGLDHRPSTRWVIASTRDGRPEPDHTMTLDRI